MPLTDLANTQIPDELSDLAANFQKSFPNSYDFAKTFVQTPSSAAGGGNGVTSLDDPTYLGFNIRFDIGSPLFNEATKGNPSIGTGENFDVNNQGGAGTSTHSSGQSAVGYLSTIGETTRAQYLRAFVQGIKEIEHTRPYYFQTIEGLQEAYNKTVDMTPYGGSADGEGITVGCLEAIDLKMSALFNLYKAACYDVKYRRTVLPINLQYFTCYVDVVEIRKFKSVRNFINSLNPLSPENELSKFVNEGGSKITLRFDECVWDPTASNVVFANVTNGGSNSITTSSMKWSYGRVEIESQFAGYDSNLKDTENLQPKTLGGIAKNLGTKLLDKAVAGAENFVQRKALSFVQGLKLGNVYGLRNQVINAINNPQGLISTLQGAAAQEQTTPGFTETIGGNLFAGDIPPGGSGQTLEVNNIFPEGGTAAALTRSNIFGVAPSGPPPLQSNNIFEGDIPPGGSGQTIESDNIFDE